MLTKTQYLAAHIRDVLTNAKVDLQGGSKRDIERIIQQVLIEREASWESFDREQKQRERFLSES